uniref:Uncharacterized protein n=1 Tax=Amphilophus citrinellus TaxID=61819 RepID=A0A3Q0RZW3_AMPCI
MTRIGECSQALPLRTFDGHPGQYGGSPLVQHTTVNITTDPPKDHIIWSLLCFVHLNPCCLGLAALIHSIKARDRKMVGDVEGARRYGSTARQFNIAATVLSVVVFVIFIIVIINAPAKIASSLNHYPNRRGY